MANKRAILIVLDVVGIGAAPDAHLYGDSGAATLQHVLASVADLTLPNLSRLGLFRLLNGSEQTNGILHAAAFGKMIERSAGKDTTTGHWELAGLILDKPFPTYPQGFPPEIINEFTKRIGRGILGNYPASGTVIIEELGEEHLRTGFPIVYTSADSVFQIAAHEVIIPPELLYEYCQIAREILQGPHAVGRVIARPFIGQPGEFQRTPRRRDFSLAPTGPTVLDLIAGSGQQVHGVGKINDIFAGRGLTSSVQTKDNAAGIRETLTWLRQEKAGGLLFANLVDFDTKYGHRNDPFGFAQALSEFDACLPELLAELSGDDLLIITADHGCDPGFPGTDHTRELVPLLVYNPLIAGPIDLGVRQTFADVAASVAEWLNVAKPANGMSFLDRLKGVKA